MPLKQETREAILREIDDGEPEVGLKAIYLNLAREHSPADSTFLDRAADIVRRVALDRMARSVADTSRKIAALSRNDPEPSPGYRQD